MKIIYVDDEKVQLENFRLTVEGMEGVDSLNLFSDSMQAYEWVKTHPTDVAFLDIEMPKMNGIEFAEKLKKLNRKICVVFVTAYDQYMLNAFGVRAAGYLLKPYTRMDIENELENARFLIGESAKKKICICTMPDLLVTVNGRNLFPAHSKLEELFALLVDRGRTGITKGDALGCLWEGKIPSDSTYWTSLFRLKGILKDAGAPELLISNGNTKHLNMEIVDCDLYRMLNGDQKIIESYAGIYLRRYSWAEERVAQLNEIKRNRESRTIDGKTD